VIGNLAQTLLQALLGTEKLVRIALRSFQHSKNIEMKKTRTENKSLLKRIRKLGCLICGAPDADPAHIRSVGAGGPDEEWNLIPLCRREHQIQHTVGWAKFAHDHYIVRLELDLKGWEFDESGKLWNPKLK
jgi:5-methylcytosine-specific restriction endonuclease McrA